MSPLAIKDCASRSADTVRASRQGERRNCFRFAASQSFNGNRMRQQLADRGSSKRVFQASLSQYPKSTLLDTAACRFL